MTIGLGCKWNLRVGGLSFAAVFLLLCTICAKAESVDEAVVKLVDGVTEQLSAGQIRMIGVLEFVNNSPEGEILRGDTGSVGRYAAERMEERLVKTSRGRYRVVERQRLSAVIEEIRLQVSDLAKQEPLQKISGRIVGLDALVLGTLTRMRDQLSISVKVVDPRTAVNLAMESAKVPLSPDLVALFGESAYVPSGKGGKAVDESALLGEAHNNVAASKNESKLTHPFGQVPKALPYSVRVLTGGLPVKPSFEGNDMFVGVSPGHPYAIELSNLSRRRVAVALLIDGLNSLGQARELPSEAQKWVLDPKEKVVIDGWQVDSETVRQFVFTGAESSLAHQKGFCEDIGLITACFYPEVVKENAADLSGFNFSRSTLGDKLGTGEGKKLESQVSEVAIEYESVPVAIINIRYDLPTR